MMTHRERFLCALDHKIPDYVPTFELEFQLEQEFMGKPFLHEEMLKGLSRDRIEEKLKKNALYLIKVYTALEHDAICIHYIREDHLCRTAELIREYSGDTFALFCHGDGTLGIPDGDGMEQLAIRMFEDPDTLKEECERSLKRAMRHNRVKRSAGFDGFILCSDYCFNKGPFMSPVHFSEFIFPYLRREIRAIRKMGAYAIKHTDGNIMPIIDQLVKAEPHAIHSLDPMAGVDIREVKKEYGDKVALCGNVHCAMLQTGSESDIIKSCEYCLTWGKPGGGYIFSTSNIPFKGMQLKRYLLVLDVWKRMRDY